MSNRFQRLELESAQPPPRAAGETAPLPESAEMHDNAHWMRVADRSRRRGLFEQALREYSRAVETDRTVVASWVGQVRMLIALGEFPEAELWAAKALELFRNHPDLNAARAQALCRVGDIPKALAAADAALHQPGQSVYPWLVRGDCLLARKDPVEEHCFNKAAEMSADWVTLVDIAEIYMHYRRHSKALARLQKALAMASDQPYLWLLRGQCESAMGLADAARHSFQQVLDLDPRNEDARTGMTAPAGGGWLRRLFGRKS